MPPYYESAAYVAAPANSAHATSPPLAPGPRRSIGGSPRLEAARGRLRRRLKRLRELVLPGTTRPSRPLTGAAEYAWGARVGRHNDRRWTSTASSPSGGARVGLQTATHSCE
eukprot:scaffold130087_cov36-Phaeocystis_antarctica.AAC.1